MKVLGPFFGQYTLNEMSALFHNHIEQRVGAFASYKGISGPHVNIRFWELYRAKWDLPECLTVSIIREPYTQLVSAWLWYTRDPREKVLHLTEDQQKNTQNLTKARLDKITPHRLLDILCLRVFDNISSTNKLENITPFRFSGHLIQHMCDPYMPESLMYDLAQPNGTSEAQYHSAIFNSFTLLDFVFILEFMPESIEIFQKLVGFNFTFVHEHNTLPYQVEIKNYIRNSEQLQAAFYHHNPWTVKYYYSMVAEFVNTHNTYFPDRKPFVAPEFVPPDITFEEACSQPLDFVNPEVNS